MKEITLEKLRSIKPKIDEYIPLGDERYVATPEWNQDVFGWVYAIRIPDQMDKKQIIDEISKTLISECWYKMSMMVSTHWYDEIDPSYEYDGYLVLREKLADYGWEFK